MSDSDSEILEVIGSSLKQKNKVLKQLRNTLFENRNIGQSSSLNSFTMNTEQAQAAYTGLPSAPTQINITSAVPPTLLSKDEFQLYCNLIPEFNPESQYENDLTKFIRKTDKYYAQMIGKLTPVQSIALEEIIENKIKGEAANYIGFLNCKDWNEIKAALLLKYGDQRNEEILANELRMCVQMPRDSCRDFYYKTLIAFNDLMKCLQLRQQSEEMFNMKRIHYTELAISTFKLGLREPFREYVDKFQINSLEEGLAKCLEYDNKMTQQNYYDYLRNQNKTKLETKPIYHKQTPHHISSNIKFPAIPQSQQQQRSSTFPPHTFGNQKLSAETLQPPKQGFPENTNKFFPQAKQPWWSQKPQFPVNNFKPPQFPANNFRPPQFSSNNFQSQQHKPRVNQNSTPMSVQSRVHTDRFNNRFKTQNQPKFHVEELFNQEDVPNSQFLDYEPPSVDSREFTDENFPIEASTVGNLE